MTEFELATTQTLQTMSANQAATAQKVSDLHRELLGNGEPGRISKVEEAIKRRDSIALWICGVVFVALLALAGAAASNWHQQAITNAQPAAVKR